MDPGASSCLLDSHGTLTVAVATLSWRLQYDRIWKQKKTECERMQCSHLVPMEADNCVNSCTSAACYNEVYAAQPVSAAYRRANVRAD